MPYKSEAFIEILDTTLRDGEQTPGVSFSPAEKLAIAKCLLTHLRVDRIEIGSARGSDSEKDSLRSLCAWASRKGYLDALEILGFIDDGKSVEWISATGCRTVNLLAKGSPRHCRVQLRKSPDRHFNDVCREISRAVDAGLAVNVYLEDWSNGMKDDFGYVYGLVSRIAELPVKKVMLADTLGVLTPGSTAEYCKWMVSSFKNLAFDFHGHNDYGLVTANSLAAVNSGITAVHTSINGLGERAGNQPLSQLCAAVNDLTDCRLRVQEKELCNASALLEAVTGKRMAWNYPVVGSDVYTQTCGVHADGDRKGELYVNLLMPERFGRRRDYALGKLAGMASLDQNLEQLPGLPKLDDSLREKVLAEVIRLSEKKKNVSASDLPFIVSSVMRSPGLAGIKVVDFESVCRLGAAPAMKVRLSVYGKEVESTARGDGTYDAFVKALKKCLKPLGFALPKLVDYQVRIPPGGRTDAIVETTICWQISSGRRIISSAVDSDQLFAAIQATEKMLNTIFPAPAETEQ